MSDLQLKKASEFCNNNLRQCCIELLEMKNTGILKDGKVRELIKMLNFAGHSSMPLAEEMIKTMAIEYLVYQDETKWQ